MMKLKLFFLGMLCTLAGFISAQDVETYQNSIYSVKNVVEPFMYTTSTLTSKNTPWTANYISGFGENLSQLYGFNGLEQQVGVKGYLGRRFTLNTVIGMGVATETGAVNTAFRAEVIRDILGGKQNSGLRLGAGLGVAKDYGNAFGVVGRITGTYESNRWKVGGNLFLEKMFAENHDDIDVLTSVGAQYRIVKNFYGGIEAIGEDLEGLWDADEDEGGAKMMVGPSLNLVPENMRFSFALSAGPMIWLTHSKVVNTGAIRQLPGETGFILRARIIFDLS